MLLLWNVLAAVLCVTLASPPLSVEVVQTVEKPTTKGAPADRLTPKPSVPLTPTSTPGIKTIQYCAAPCFTACDLTANVAVFKNRVDPTQTFQEIRGFGGAITDSVASVFSKLNDENQQKVIEMLWGASGQKYNMMRLTIGATDFSTTAEYSFDDTDGDFTMSHFSISHDEKQIVPMAQRARDQALNVSGVAGQIEFLATPWSPPAWMKRNKHMRNSDEPGLNQDNKTQEAYALYLSRYISAMAGHGINISRMTVQNEPHVKGQFAATYPCCGMNAEDELKFLRDFLGPRMSQDHPNLDIYIHDDQKDIMVPYVSTIMSDPKAKQYVAGVAFHWYGANLKNYQYLQQLQESYPDLPLLATEATLEAPASQNLGTTPWKEAMKYAVDIMGDLNQWTTGWIEWNVLLDSSGGPTCIGPSGTSVCTPLVGHCDAPILADTDKQELTVRDSYWIMGHFSRFIPRGSHRCAHSGATDPNSTILSTAVVTPNGDLVVVVQNSGDSDTKYYQLEVPNLSGELGNETLFANFSLPPHGIQTLTVRNAVSYITNSKKNRQQTAENK